MGLKLYGKPVTDYTKESLLKFVNKFYVEHPEKALPLLKEWTTVHGGQVLQLAITEKPFLDIYYSTTNGSEVCPDKDSMWEALFAPSLSNKFVLTMPDGVDLFFETDGAMWAFINKQPKQDLKYLHKVGPTHFQIGKDAWQKPPPSQPLPPDNVIINPNNALIIWASTLDEKKTEDGKYEYFQSFAVIVRPHRTEKLVRIWVTDVNGEPKRLIYDADQDFYKEDGLTLTYYDGTQNKPDPLLVKHLGKGAPSYKGSSYVVFKSFNLTKHDSNKMPHLKFEVKLKSPDKTLDQAEEEWAATLIKPEVQLAAKVEQPPEGWIKKPASAFDNDSSDWGTDPYSTKPYTVLDAINELPPITIEVDKKGKVTGLGDSGEFMMKFNAKPPGAKEVFQVPSMLSPEKAKKFIDKMKNVPPMSQKGKVQPHWKDFHIGVEKNIKYLHYNVSICYHDASMAQLTKTMKIPYDVLGKEGHGIIKSLDKEETTKAIYDTVINKGWNPLDLSRWHEVILQTLGLIPTSFS
jgi:hypothetical protein